MTNCEAHFTNGIFLNGDELQEAITFKYLDYIIKADKGSKKEII